MNARLTFLAFLALALFLGATISAFLGLRHGMPAVGFPVAFALLLAGYVCGDRAETLASYL